jgi:DNA repair exonuclease
MKILITADWHVRGERPLCRLDEDWIESQRKTISEIRSVFENNGCDQIWILGDVFDAPRCATAAVNMLIGELKKFPFDSVKILCGNHDLKDHNYGNLEECSIGTLKKIFGDVPDVIANDGIGSMSVSAKPFALDDLQSTADVICTHQLTFPNAEARPMPDCGVLAQDLLDRWREAEVIFTGDYHHGYVFKEDWDTLPGRYVVTPGCINIQKADELDYQPFVVVWDTKSASGDYAFEKFYLDPQRENCTRDHIEAREQNEEQLAQVVETIKGGAEITLDFDSNLAAAVAKCDANVVEEYGLVRQEVNAEK